MKLKDLKITYNTLCELDYPVPTELMVHMAEKIRSAEATFRDAIRQLDVVAVAALGYRTGIK